MKVVLKQVVFNQIKNIKSSKVFKNIMYLNLLSKDDKNLIKNINEQSKSVKSPEAIEVEKKLEEINAQ